MFDFQTFSTTRSDKSSFFFNTQPDVPAKLAPCQIQHLCAHWSLEGVQNGISVQSKQTPYSSSDNYREIVIRSADDRRLIRYFFVVVINKRLRALSLPMKNQDEGVVQLKCQSGRR